MALEELIVGTGLSPEAVVALLAMLPISELRGAIPVALGIYSMPPVKAYAIAVLGNILPVVPLLLFFGPAERSLRRVPQADSFFEWLFARTRRNAGEDIQRYGALGLAIFVAIPLPATGAWTGALAAYLFGLRFWRSLAAICLGVLLAGVIVTLASLGFTFLIA